MKQLVRAERFCLIGHLLSMVFGWGGLLLVLPHPEVILNLPAFGQNVFQWSMAGGGVVNILLGAAVVAIFAYRTVGNWHWLTFMLPAMAISLGSELTGTSTGLPFGDYHYLNGLGYKIAGLVPFTIPISWFYMGLAAYLIARVALRVDQQPTWVRHVGAIALGALLFTSWDFALEPAMSQTAVPFWYWERPGAFFGTPYQNYAGWFGTSALFMTVAAIFWGRGPLMLQSNPGQFLSRAQLGLPLVIYLSNFAYAAVLSLASGFAIPVVLGVVVGVVPALALYAIAPPTKVQVGVEKSATINTDVPVAALKVGVK
jgi:uncharacterized membrane protein